MWSVLASRLAWGACVAVAVIGCGGGTDVTSVEIGVSATAGPAPLRVSFEAAVSTTRDPDDLKLSWDFGDGSSAEGEATSNTFAQPGTYFVTLSAIEDDDDVGSDVVAITVTDDRLPEVFATAETISGQVPLRVRFAARASGGDGALRYAWQFGDGGSSTVAEPTHVYTAAGRYTAAVTVTDLDGDEATSSVDVVAFTPGAGAPIAVASAVSSTCLLSDGTSIRLDASGSSDPEQRPLAYEWRVVRAPVEDDSAFTDTSSAITDFRPDSRSDGRYDLRVFVSNGEVTVASATVVVIADSRVSQIVKLSGDDQTALAGDSLAEPLIVSVQNSCGRGVPGAWMGWRGANMFVTESERFADSGGSAIAVGIGGERVGPGVIQVGAGEAVETFRFQVEPGKVGALVVDPIPSVAADSEVGVPVVVRSTDVFGNPVSADGSFEMFSNGGSFDEGIEVELVEGVGSATFVPSREPRQVFIDIARPDIGNASEEIQIFGRLAGPSSDLESRDGWRLFGDWEIGTPSEVGPTEATSGTGVLATRLDGDFGQQTDALPGPTAELLLTPGLASRASVILVEAKQWYDMGETFARSGEESSDPIPLSGGLQRFGGSNPCTQAAAMPSIMADRTVQAWNGIGFASIYRERFGSPVANLFSEEDDVQFFNAGFPGPGLCGLSRTAGFGGSTGGQWVDARFAYEPSEEGSSAVTFALQANLGAPAAPGWYLDDVRVEGLVAGGTYVEVTPAAADRVRFVGSNPEIVLGDASDNACASSGIVRLEVANENRPVLESGLRVEIELSSTAPGLTPFVSGLAQGERFEGNGARAQADTDSQGRVSFLVDVEGTSSVDAEVAVSATLVGGDGSNGTLSVLADRNGIEDTDIRCLDGIDNDCDGFTDCADQGCAERGICRGRVCEAPLSLRTERSAGSPVYTWDIDVCETGENGLSPEGFSDAIARIPSSSFFRVCVDGPAESAVELGVFGEIIRESPNAAFTCEQQVGVVVAAGDCAIWSRPSGAQGYAIARAPTSNCGEVSLRLFRFSRFDDDRDDD